MKRVYISTILSSLFFVFPAQSQTQSYSLGFVAPAVNGAPSLTNPQLGEIVYDFNNNGFYGFSQIGSWVKLSPDTYIPPAVQQYTSGDGTYITPAGAKYLKLKMIGGGGGGSGSSFVGSPGAAATNGTASNFGTIIAPGGGAGSTGSGGIGGAAPTTTGSTPIIAMVGNRGDGGTGITPAGMYSAGGSGGAGLGGGAGGGGRSTHGFNAATNSGAGGGGGGNSGQADFNTGSGGGSGAYVEVIINSPLETYDYEVGTGGTAGVAGAGSPTYSGGSGGSGYIVVEAYFQ